eukprot:TRINITY_DN3318_c0_g1_i1.p1 TRINITY_DN3318_c0_g1~~TRINITY_DN3318_c0_g1_i1.p1  ORF type:complete len:154 (+),score=12.84 TRINITY_DN3318_c0_g1_i1:79-540(+)
MREARRLNKSSSSIITKNISTSNSSSTASSKNLSSSTPSLKNLLTTRPKQLKNRCTCCHVCRASLKTVHRLSLECCQCNAVVCRQCFDSRLPNTSWDEASKKPEEWVCPVCDGTCPCDRCVKLHESTTAPVLYCIFQNYKHYKFNDREKAMIS